MEQASQAWVVQEHLGTLLTFRFGRSGSGVVPRASAFPAGSKVQGTTPGERR